MKITSNVNVYGCDLPPGKSYVYVGVGVLVSGLATVGMVGKFLFRLLK